MIDSDLIDALPTDLKLSVKDALAALAGSGILTQQIERELIQLASGSATEDEHKLATRIIEYRRKNSALLGLLELGESYQRELGYE